VNGSHPPGCCISPASVRLKAWLETGFYSPIKHGAMIGIVDLHNWARHILNTSNQAGVQKPAMKMDNYELASAVLLAIDQYKSCELNIRILEMWPEVESCFFNKRMIEIDMKHYAEQLDGLRAEVNRRWIP
jgi:hypothetical protein